MHAFKRTGNKPGGLWMTFPPNIGVLQIPLSNEEPFCIGLLSMYSGWFTWISI